MTKRTIRKSRRVDALDKAILAAADELNSHKYGFSLDSRIHPYSRRLFRRVLRKHLAPLLGKGKG